MAVWQDLVDSHGFTGRYNSVKRFVRRLRGAATPEARVVIETPRRAKKRRSTTARDRWFAIRPPASIAAHACS